MFPAVHGRRQTVAPAGATSEKLFCALLPVFSMQRVVSADPPREGQTRARGSHGTLGDVSPRRGARETVQSKPEASGVLSSDSRTVGAVDKEGGAEGSAQREPVRPWTRSLPSGVTR
jgi:hypothetical protein